MKILVFSDSHGIIEDMLTGIRENEDIDMIIHLGDNTIDAQKLKKSTDKEIINVKGNCDFGDGHTPLEKILDIDGYTLLVTHGHKYNVKWDLNALYYKALETKSHIAIFGHTHIPMVEKHEGVILLNPGSISSPRNGNKKTYGLLEIDENITVEILEVKENEVI